MSAKMVECQSVLVLMSDSSIIGLRFLEFYLLTSLYCFFVVNDFFLTELSMQNPVLTNASL